MTCCAVSEWQDSIAPTKADPFWSLAFGAWWVVGQCRHPMDALGGGINPLLTSLSGLWDKCPPEKVLCCLTQVRSASIISLHFSFSQVVSVSRWQNCPIVLWVAGPYSMSLGRALGTKAEIGRWILGEKCSQLTLSDPHFLYKWSMMPNHALAKLSHTKAEGVIHPPHLSVSWRQELKLSNENHKSLMCLTCE